MKHSLVLKFSLTFGQLFSDCTVPGTVQPWHLVARGEEIKHFPKIHYFLKHEHLRPCSLYFPFVQSLTEVIVIICYRKSWHQISGMQLLLKRNQVLVSNHAGIISYNTYQKRRVQCLWLIKPTIKKPFLHRLQNKF